MIFLGYYSTKTAYPHGQAANKHNIIKTLMQPDIVPSGEVSYFTGYLMPTT